MSRNEERLEELRRALRENDAERRASNGRHLQRAAELQAEFDAAALTPETEPLPLRLANDADVLPDSETLLLAPSAASPSEPESETVTELPPPPHLPNEAVLLQAMPPEESEASDGALDAPASDEPETA